MAQVEPLTKRRSNIKGSLTKIVNYARAQQKVEPSQLDVEQLRVRLRRAEALLIEFLSVEQAIIELKLDEQSHQDDFEEGYYNAVAELNKLIRRANLAAGNVSVDLNETQGEQVRSSNIEVKLPKINIAPFYGNYTEWQSFYDLFSSTIHDNANLNPAQKFQYLKGLLRNEAGNFLKHLPISDANFIEALNKLKARYDRKRYTVQSLIKGLMDLPSISNPNSQQIRRIMDTADEVIRGLKAIGPEAETRDPWLVYLLLQKLDDESRDRWANETANIEFPTCQLLIDFLMKRADALDSVKGYPRRTGAQVKPSTTPHTLGKAIHQSFSHTATSCTVCKGDYHLLYLCPKFKEWTVEQRRELIKTENRCFNCLSASHPVYKCKSKGRCYICKRRHNSLLHTTTDNSSSSSEKNGNHNAAESSDNLCGLSQPPPEKPLDQKLCLHSKQEFQSAILPTATVKVKDRNGLYHFCRALLDSGSQHSFITETFAQNLGLERTNGRICIQGLADRKLLTTRGIVDLVISPHFKSNFRTETPTYVIPAITTINSIPKEADWLKYKGIDSNLALADISSKTVSKIDLLIGADKFFDILKPEQLKDSDNKIYAHNTQFGWIITGVITTF